MKHIIKLILIAGVFGVFLVSQGCKKDKGPGESIEDIQLGKLSKVWTIDTASPVTLDGATQTGYDNFTLTISGTAGNTSFGYSVAGSPTPNPWPASGLWSFGGVPETEIVRDPDTNDVLNMTYSVSATQLQITFNFTGTGYPGTGRTSNVNGQWVFTFN